MSKQPYGVTIIGVSSRLCAMQERRWSDESASQARDPKGVILDPGTGSVKSGERGLEGKSAGAGLISPKNSLPEVRHSTTRKEIKSPPVARTEGEEFIILPEPQHQFLLSSEEELPA